MRIIAGLLAAAVILLVVELGMGAWSFGGTASENACTTTSSYPGGGIDAAIQRVVIDGLYGAACELGTTREELVLALGSSPSGERIRWDEKTIERAVRAGLLRSIERAEARGDLPGPAAYVLRVLTREAPVAALIRGGSRFSDLLGSIFS